MPNSSPTLFIPGTLCDERVWLPVWQRMAQINRRYVPLQWASSMDEMLALTEDRVLPDEKVNIVGFSLGGFVAASWAIANPAKVNSLTLVGYDGAGLSKDELTKRKDLLAHLKKGQFNPASKAYLARFIHSSKLNDDAVAQTVIDMSKDLGTSTLINQINATTPRPSTLEGLKSINAPIHIVSATDDNVALSSGLSAMHAQLPHSHFYSIEDAGHMMLLEQPDKLATLLTSILT